MTIGDKYRVALGDFRGTSHEHYDWVLPEVMLPDGSVVTIKRVYETYGDPSLEVEECNYNYPAELLVPLQDKKSLALKAIKALRC
jgi:hypothetical protein